MPLMMRVTVVFLENSNNFISLPWPANVNNASSLSPLAIFNTANPQIPELEHLQCFPVNETLISLVLSGSWSFHSACCLSGT